MIRPQEFVASLYLCCGVGGLTGCSGHIVDLDHSPPPPASTPDAGARSPSEGEIGGIWVDAQRLYWSTYGAPTAEKAFHSKSYRGCLKHDCEHTALTYTTFDAPSYDFSIDDHHLYWAQSLSKIYSCQTEDCPGSTVLVADDPARFGRRIFGHQGYVYWSSDSDLLRCPATGCAPVPEVVARSTIAQLMVFDGTRAYWQTEEGIFSGPSDGSEPPETMTTKVIPPKTGDPYENNFRGLALGGEYLYWTTSRHVFRCPIANCLAAGPTLLTTTSKEINDFKLDDRTMYWVEGSLTGSSQTEFLKLAVRSCPVSGCQQSIVLTPLSLLGAGSDDENARYAVDESVLYWIETPDAPNAPTTGVLRAIAR